MAATRSSAPPTGMVVRRWSTFRRLAGQRRGAGLGCTGSILFLATALVTFPVLSGAPGCAIAAAEFPASGGDAGASPAIIAELQLKLVHPHAGWRRRFSRGHAAARREIRRAGGQNHGGGPEICGAGT